MRIVINNISVPIDHKIEDVLFAAQKIVRQCCISAEDFAVYRQSIDARRRNNIHYVYSVSAKVDTDSFTGRENIKLLDDGADLVIPKLPLKSRPVVVGMGPCGLFAAYALTLSGNPPIILERGECVEERTKSVEGFWNGSRLNTESNVQFGEGGAGTFSDGKLNTNVSDNRQRFILETFVRFGAPNDILYRAKPHIGTDKLKDVLINMRRFLLENGCEIRFNTKLTGVKIKGGVLSEIELDKNTSMPCNILFLGIGHSSRDTFEMLYSSGVPMEQKPFAAGVRIEHLQEFIGLSRYGDEFLKLPPADYKLVYNGKDRSCYSFCMCPGGTVVNASSEEGRLVVNGMSNHSRNGKNANSALIVTVRPDDFASDSPLGGVEFQRKYEELAFRLGGGDYTAPVQLARDFLRGRESDSFGSVTPSYTGKTAMKNLRQCLPKFISRGLTEGLNSFEKKIHGYAGGDAVMTGVEMRTSSPIRIPRDESFECTSVKGLYPIGEGAGYAGGIVSAALDGVKAAVAVVNN